MIDEYGENSIVVAPGANAAFTPEWAYASLDRLQQGDVVVAQAEIPPAVLEVCAQVCSASGAVFVLNLAPVIDVDVLKLAPDFLVVNEHEARELAAGQEPRAWAATLHGSGVTVVETLGATGSRIHTDTVVEVPAVTAEAVVDTTGAGDAFVGVFAAAIAAGLGVADAVAWGAAGGALAVAVEGAQGARFTRADVVRMSGVDVP